MKTNKKEATSKTETSKKTQLKQIIEKGKDTFYTLLGISELGELVSQYFLTKNTIHPQKTEKDFEIES